MATTSAFGWETPDDTDLVKDGAAAIRTLGNSIDTSMSELKGGTTGQILSKTSNTDMDFTWVAATSGDITAVTAGTGISGGGTSGDVTITNSMATAITTNGDLIYGTGSGTFTRRGIGSTGQVLTVSSGVPTWATPSSPAAVGCAAYANAISTTFSAVTNTILPFNNEEFDTDAFHDNSTNNSRLTIPTGKGGKYLITGMVNLDEIASQQSRLRLYKNGSLYGNGMVDGTFALLLSSNALGVLTGSITTTAVAGDYFQLGIFVNGSVTANWSGRFEAIYLGA